VKNGVRITSCASKPECLRHPVLRRQIDPGRAPALAVELCLSTNPQLHPHSLNARQRSDALSAVRKWPVCDTLTSSRNVRSQESTGKHLLRLSSSRFDPKRSSKKRNPHRLSRVRDHAALRELGWPPWTSDGRSSRPRLRCQLGKAGRQLHGTSFGAGQETIARLGRRG
jgi:hypothetical protein